MNKHTLDIVNEIVLTAKNKRIAQLISDDDSLDGRIITIEKRKLINFGSYSYLHLEVDERLKKASVEAIQKFGISYPSSKAYITTKLYPELEGLLARMFQSNVVVTQSLSLGHHGVMPVVITENQAVILDQHVHASVQDAARKLQLNGVTLTMVRHNRMDELVKKIEELSNSHEKVWYASDSLYSMYGDCAPLKEITQLLDKHKKFHLYVDDAHGMSVYGKHGTGFVLSQTDLHPKMILAVGMAKGFGVEGGVFIIPDFELSQKVRNCSGSLIFSGALSIPVLAACIASANIHLSPEITIRQRELMKRVRYCCKLLKKYNLPDISDENTPIFFIALGSISFGYNVVKRIIDAGFFVNIAAFPAVAKTCTGIRFTITLAHELKDIDLFVATLAEQYRLALIEENVNLNDISRAFRRAKDISQTLLNLKEHIPVAGLSDKNPQQFSIQHETTIQNINKQLWNQLFLKKGVFDWEALLFQEKTFQENEKKEHNWEFHYFIVYDKKNNPVLATFCTIALAKDDMLSPSSVSEEIELRRIHEPYYMTSYTMMMGSLITEGEHLYINFDHKEWRYGLGILTREINNIFHGEPADQLMFRDFDSENEAFNSQYNNSDFVKISIASNHSLTIDWKNKEEFLGTLKSKSRKYIKEKVFAFEGNFQVDIIQGFDSDKVEHWEKLCSNVIHKNMSINTFDLPKAFFVNLAQSTLWEVIELKLSSKQESQKLPIAVMLCYKGNESYVPVFVGMDYEYLDDYIYPQILWQAIKRAQELQLNTISLGFTASQNKRKFGALTLPKVAFVQLKDSFNNALISLIPKKSKSR